MDNTVKSIWRAYLFTSKYRTFVNYKWQFGILKNFETSKSSCFLDY